MKQQLFSAVKKAVRLPHHVYQHLHFEGSFRLQIDERTSISLLHCGGSGENALFWTGLDGDYEPLSLDLWRRLVPLSNVIVDAGAHHGLFSLVAKALNPSASVLAFEPVARIGKVMEQNIAANGMEISVYDAAISDVTGTSTFFDLPDDQPVSASLDSEVARLRPDSVPVEIATLRLDDALAQRRLTKVDLMKIDVERHEPAVLRGMGAHLAADQPTILLEILNENVAEAVEALIRGLSYRRYLLQEAEHRLELRETLSFEGVVGQNWLLIRPDIAERIGIS